MFSPNNEYLVVDNGVDQIVVFETSYWGNISTITLQGNYKEEIINYIGYVGFSSNNQYFGEVEADNGTFLDLNSGITFRVICDSANWIINGASKCYDETGSEIVIVLEPRRHNSGYIDQVEYYFNADSLSLIATHPFEPKKEKTNEIVNEPLKFSTLIEKICIGRKNGDVIQCIVPPKNGFPLDKDGYEIACFKSKAFGVSGCEYLDQDGPSSSSVGCDGTVIDCKAGFVTSIEYKDKNPETGSSQPSSDAKISSQIKEICLEKRNGPKIQCVVPPKEGFPFGEDGNERVCFDNVLGTGITMCSSLYIYGQISGLGYKCYDNCENAPRGLDVVVYPVNIFTFGLRELCSIPLGGSPICNQTDAWISSTTTDRYTIRSVSDTSAEIYTGQGNVFLTTITYRPPYTPSFNPIPWITITPDRRYLVYATEYAIPNTFFYSQTMHILDLTSGKEKTESNGQYTRGVVISPNSRYFAFTLLKDEVKRIALWDLEKGGYVFSNSLEVAPALAFSPDNLFLLYVERNFDRIGVIYFYSIEDGATEKQIEIDLTRSNVSALAFSRDGSILAVGFTDGLIRLYDVQNNIELHKWDAHNGSIKSLEFSPNDQMLLSVGAIDQYAKIWGILP